MIGIISIVTFFLILPALAAVVLAVVGIVRTSKRARARRGRVPAVIGGVLGIVSLVGGALLFIAVDRSHAFQGHLTSYSGLSSGACFNPPTGIVRLFHEVACSGDHRGEVTGSFQDSAGPDAPYPGPNLVSSGVILGCQRQTTGFVGAPLDPTRYRLYYYGPTARQWSNGSRTIVCTVRSADGSLLRGSIRGA